MGQCPDFVPLSTVRRFRALFCNPRPSFGFCLEGMKADHAVPVEDLH